MVTQEPAGSPDLDRGPAVAAMVTASTTTPAVRVSGDDTESSNSNNGSNSEKAGDKEKADNGITSRDNFTENSSIRSNNNSISNSNSEKRAGDKDEAGNGLTNFKPSPRFWAILITCAVIGLLSALENTVITTALPYIVTELEIGEDYVWITNVFFLTGAAFQPIFGQLADIYGRRWVTMAIVAFFTLGSGISGGAKNSGMLIAGRAIQGVGSGGIYIIIDIIIGDLVPLRVRGNYLSVVLVVYTIGLAIGPFVGGIIAERATWRWVFYLTLPIGGLSLIMIFLFLRTSYNRSETQRQKLARIDYIGNLILVASTVSILYATTYGGTRYPWSSARILSPLLIGFAGFALFGYYETKAKEPVLPPNLFSNRTTVIIFVATFLNSTMVYWILFFLPVYFQAVLGASASQSGVDILPTILLGLPGSIVAVLMLARWGEYKPLHIFGFGFAVIGNGLYTLLNRHTTTAQWVGFQLIQAIGTGFVLNTLLPAVQAQLPERYLAATTSAWAFMRSFGSIWGVAIPAAIFNNRFAQLAWRIEDPAARDLFSGGGKAYENAYASFIGSFPETTRDQIIDVYQDALKLLWQISIAFAGANFLIVLFEKRVSLRTELETEYGLEEDKEKRKKDGEAAVDIGEAAMSNVVAEDSKTGIAA
ncbi:major facilitator superfamily domain-containing protein [Xylaria curta]|nr:major facilitator superfamily domain-containing protein [Xylaria curta]